MLAGYRLVEQLARVPMKYLQELNPSIPHDGAFDMTLTPGDHVCSAINDMLRQLGALKVVRIDIALICPILLSKSMPDRSLPLQTLLVDCSNSSDQRGLGSFRCDDFRGGRASDAYVAIKVIHQRSLKVLAKDLATAAKDFSEAMKTPKQVRVMSPNELAANRSPAAVDDKLQDTVFAWDCLTDEVRTFPRSKGWDWGGQVDLDEALEAGEEKLAVRVADFLRTIA